VGGKKEKEKEKWLVVIKSNLYDLLVCLCEGDSFFYESAQKCATGNFGNVQGSMFKDECSRFNVLGFLNVFALFVKKMHVQLFIYTRKVCIRTFFSKMQQISIPKPNGKRITNHF
jgi:hypothetical protein